MANPKAVAAGSLFAFKYEIVVLLMHDYSNVTIESLPKIINEFKKRNFIFLPLFYDSVKVIKN